MKLTVVITGGKDQFGSWIEELPGIYGSGDTLDDVKKDIALVLNLYIEENGMPDLIKDGYDFEFIFDTKGMIRYLNEYFKYTGMEQITGVPYKQLWGYGNSDIKPRKETASNIVEKINTFGKVLSEMKVKI